MAETGNVILDGRDIGTVVLKDSKCKFFLTFGPSLPPEGMNPEAGGHLQGVQRLQPSDSLPGGFPGVGSHTEQVQGRLPV